MSRLVFVDCEAPYGCLSPASGDMTEFGAVVFTKEGPFAEFHGKDCTRSTFEEFRLWLEKHVDGKPTFVSDNPAYDWQWINFYFDKHFGVNPFGFSARRVGDFYAGLRGDFWRSNDWKRLRVTAHDHHPVHDARGNAEAFRRILRGEAAP